MMNDFFTQSPQWHLKIGEIHALLERVKISEEGHGDVLRLRKLNRILSILPPIHRFHAGRDPKLAL
jgi:hypothetical protein